MAATVARVAVPAATPAAAPRLRQRRRLLQQPTAQALSSTPLPGAAASRGGTPIPCHPPLAMARRRGRALTRPGAAQPRSSQDPQQGRGDLEAEVLGSQSFQGLAKAVAGKLAEAAGQEGALNRLKLWLDKAEAVGEAARPATEAAEQAGKSTGGLLGKAASIAASVLGVPGGAQKAVREWAGKEETPVDKAARYLGADSVHLTVDAVQKWLASPERRDDAKMVGALVHKMLQFLEKETGEPFQGKDKQYSWLATLAGEVFGGSLTSRVVRALVDAYLKVPGR